MRDCKLKFFGHHASQTNKEMVRLSSGSWGNSHWHSVSMLAVEQEVLRAVAISVPHWNKGQSNVKKNPKWTVARILPFFRESWQSDILCILYEIWFLNKCRQLTWLKTKTLKGPNKIHLEGLIQPGVTSSQLLVSYVAEMGGMFYF